MPIRSGSSWPVVYLQIKRQKTTILVLFLCVVHRRCQLRIIRPQTQTHKNIHQNYKYSKPFESKTTVGIWSGLVSRKRSAFVVLRPGHDLVGISHITSWLEQCLHWSQYVMVGIMSALVTIRHGWHSVFIGHNTS